MTPTQLPGRATAPYPALVAVSFLSGVLALVVGLDYLPRLGPLGAWDRGYVVIRALRGAGLRSDLTQDYAGARALLGGGDAYEPLGVIAYRLAPNDLENLGGGNFDEISTHPPTAFLLFLPLAGLPYPVAVAAWTLLMVVGLMAAIRALGAPAHVAAFLGPVLVLLPPVAEAMEQLTLAWLLLLVFAFRRRHQPSVAGALIGVAALTKLLPAVVLGALLGRCRRERWRALAGFAAVWLAALGTVAVLNASALASYLGDVRASATPQLARPDNGAFLVFSTRQGGIVALAVCLALVAWVIWADVRHEFGDGPYLGSDWLRWARWTWLSVALLPITWFFSVVPLGLVAVLLFRGRRVALGALATASFLPVLAPLREAPGSALAPFLTIVGTGLAVALADVRRRRSQPSQADRSRSIVAPTPVPQSCSSMR